MATPVKEKNGKTYGIRAFYYDNLGRKKQKYKGGFKTANQAVVWAENFNAKTNVDKDLKSLFSFIEYFLEVKKAENLAPVTLADYEYYFKLIKNEFGNCLLETLTTPQLQYFLNKFKDTPCKSRHIKQTLSALFTLAYKQDILDRNPFEKVIKPKYEKNDICCYNIEQANELLKILKEQQPKYYIFALILVTLGLRPNEATILKTSSVICRNNDYYIFIDKAFSKVHNLVSKETREYIKKPKSKAGVREIPI